MTPISREKAKLYPSNWRAIRAEIMRRAEIGDGFSQCECDGECGLHRTTPGPRRCEEIHNSPAKWARGKVVLTIAHLNHDPTDNRPENLKALCNRCHLRYDSEHHQRNAAATRRRKKDEAHTGRLL